MGSPEAGSVVERLREFHAESMESLGAAMSLQQLLQKKLPALLAVVEAAQALYDTHEIQMYVGHEAVSGGHIGYCSRTLGSKLAALHAPDSAGEPE